MKDDKELNDQIRSDALTKAAGHNADWVMRALISIRGMEEGVWSGEDITNCVIRFAGKPTDKNVWIVLAQEAKRADLITHTDHFKVMQTAKGAVKSPLYYVTSS